MYLKRDYEIRQNRHCRIGSDLQISFLNTKWVENKKRKNSLYKENIVILDYIYFTIKNIVLHKLIF